MAEDARAEKARSGFGHEAEIDERRLQHGARTGENHIAMEHQRGPDPNCRAVSRRNEGLVAFDESLQKLEAVPNGAALACR